MSDPPVSRPATIIRTFSICLTLFAFLTEPRPARAQTHVLLSVDEPAQNAVVVQPFMISGWAADLSAPADTGIQAIRAWLSPLNPAQPATEIPQITYGLARPDVAAIHGQQYLNSGFGASVKGVVQGPYILHIAVKRVQAPGFDDPYTLPLTVLAHPQVWLDLPPYGSVVHQPFSIAGWAGDLAADIHHGTGVDTVSVSSCVGGSGDDGAPCVYLGDATYGLPRPDVASVFGPQFEPSGFVGTIAGRPSGLAELTACATFALTTKACRSTLVYIDPQVPSPTITPGTGTYNDPPIITISTWMPQTQIRYTLDGTTPTETSPLYTAPLDITQTTIIKAVAFRDEWTPSEVSEATLTLKVAQPVASMQGGTYSTHFTTFLTTQTPGAEIRYTLDGSPPTGTSTLYHSLVMIDRSLTLRARAFKGGWNQSTGMTATYVLTVPPPQCSPPGGTYNNVIAVALATALPSTAIRYTVDGSSPSDTSPLYAAPIEISAPSTLRARAFRTGWTSSGEATCAFGFVSASPMLAPAGGTYPPPLQVVITTPTAAATVRYTTNGTVPTPSSPVAPPEGVSLAAGTTVLTAMAFRPSWQSSPAVSQTYTVTAGALAAPTVVPGDGTYSVGQMVTMSHPVPGASIRYTTDGAEPTEASILYVAPIPLQVPTTLKARAFRTGFTPSPIVTRTYVLQVATPTITPPSGPYTEAVWVNMSTTTAGATIRYTTDAEDPTESSSIYVGSRQLPLDTVLKVRAYKAGWEASAIAVATFIDGPSEYQSSDGVAQLSGAAADGVAALGSSLTVTLTGAQYDTDETQIVIVVNGQPLSANQFFATPTQITISPYSLLNGRNELHLGARDSEGWAISGAFTVWAGTRSVTLRTRDRAGANIPAATVQLRFASEDGVVLQDVGSSSGSVTFDGLPTTETFVVTATREGYLSREITVLPGTSSASPIVTMDLDNNDFRAGLAGWSTPLQTATVGVHSEAPRGWVPCPECTPRQFGPAEGGGDRAPGSSGPNNDLWITTKNKSLPQTGTRVFTASADAHAVSVRYRFATFEHFWPNPENDWYQVTITNLTTQAVVRDLRSYLVLRNQQLLDGLGTTPWFTLAAPVSAGDAVEVRVTVANANDSAIVSELEIDSVDQVVYSVEATLNDVHYRPTQVRRLEFLSVAASDAWNGRVHVYGTLRFRGAPTDSLKSVVLELYENDLYRTAGVLVTAAADELLGVPFGTDGVSVVASQKLFEFQSATLGQLIEESTNDYLTVHVHATTAAGLSITQRTPVRLDKLIQYTGHNRYPEEPDELIDCVVPQPKPQTPDAFRPPAPCGGDQWLRPSVLALVGMVPPTLVLWGDFSNMNGGLFPPHRTHDKGTHVDGWFEGYNERDEAAGRRLAEVLSHLPADRIMRVWVTTKAAFWRGLDAGPRLSDGASARTKVRFLLGHASHFHIDLVP
jgi:hypothetical protein